MIEVENFRLENSGEPISNKRDTEVWLEAQSGDTHGKFEYRENSKWFACSFDH